MANNLDSRITPARPDLAAAHLKGQVQADRFVEGEKFLSLRGHMPLRAKPSPHAAQETELLCGEIFTVYEQKDGWCWGQIEADGYVGYVHALSLQKPVAATHRVAVLGAPVLLRPEVKAACMQILPMNAVVRLEKDCGDFLQTNAGFVFARHLAALDVPARDFVAVAQRFVGAPYVWGGKTVAGLDCSGLIQTALTAAGVAAPRDTDMMEATLGQPVAAAEKRGDLVFWKGHMGVMLDGQNLLHANAFHMAVAVEPLAEAIARIANTAGPVSAIRRF